ncbi:MAG: hypothetical protein EOO16_26210 [Chitinophagaceae bacterium]|nr:MAG: hypothetical protein EOO16_26210 [Chitinophagaceae bacterium]
MCSGSQLLAFVPLQPAQEGLISSLLLAFSRQRESLIALDPAGLRLDPEVTGEVGLEFTDEENWRYTETLDQRPVIHIIGAGHVGLALSQQMSLLGFYIRLYDNRPGLNTFLDNPFAHEKIVCDYENIDSLLEASENDFVVIMTFGYRDDKIVFRRLLHKRFYYLGMLGSDAKILTLMRELEAEGVSPDSWQHCFVPVGLPIYSKTAAEIAVSIAAEIIREKNRDLPTGRSGLPLAE